MSYRSHEELEVQLKQHQDRLRLLVNLWLMFFIFLAGGIALPRMAVRFFGTYAYFVVMAVVIIVLAFVGVSLLAQTIRTRREIRLLRKDLRRLETEERKRDRARQKKKKWNFRRPDRDNQDETVLVIGSDGELVEVEPEQQSDFHNGRSSAET
ncbi:MAG: hypothetical protein ACOCX3_02985 [Chloroflexota bacterium]